MFEIKIFIPNIVKWTTLGVFISAMHYIFTHLYPDILIAWSVICGNISGIFAFSIMLRDPRDHLHHEMCQCINSAPSFTCWKLRIVQPFLLVCLCSIVHSVIDYCILVHGTINTTRTDFLFVDREKQNPQELYKGHNLDISRSLVKWMVPSSSLNIKTLA